MAPHRRRRPVNFGQSITTRLPPGLVAAIDRLADAEFCRRSDLIRAMLESAVARGRR